MIVDTGTWEVYFNPDYWFQVLKYQSLANLNIFRISIPRSRCYPAEWNHWQKLKDCRPSVSFQSVIQNMIPQKPSSTNLWKTMATGDCSSCKYHVALWCLSSIKEESSIRKLFDLYYHYIVEGRWISPCAQWLSIALLRKQCFQLYQEILTQKMFIW